MCDYSLDYFEKREIKEALKDKVREISKKRNRWGWNLDIGEELYNFIEKEIIEKIVNKQEAIFEKNISELRKDYEEEINELHTDHNDKIWELKNKIDELTIENKELKNRIN